MQEEFQNLHILVSKESFAVKTKFPQTLRAPLAEVALKAVELDEYGENFFKYLTEIFPYNKFTMTVRSPCLLVTIVLLLMIIRVRNLSRDSSMSAMLRFSTIALMAFWMS